MKKIIGLILLLTFLLVSSGFAEMGRMDVAMFYPTISFDGNFNPALSQITGSNEIFGSGYGINIGYDVTDNLNLSFGYKYFRGSGAGLKAPVGGEIKGSQDGGQIRIKYKVLDQANGFVVLLVGDYSNSTLSIKYPGALKLAVPILSDSVDVSVGYSVSAEIRKVILPFIPFVVLGWGEKEVFKVQSASYIVGLGTYIGFSQDLPLFYFNAERLMGMEGMNSNELRFGLIFAT